MISDAIFCQTLRKIADKHLRIERTICEIQPIFQLQTFKKRKPYQHNNICPKCIFIIENKSYQAAIGLVLL